MSSRRVQLAAVSSFLVSIVAVAGITASTSSAARRPQTQTRYSVVSQNGFKATVTIDIYGIYHARPGLPPLPFSGRTSPDGCSVNPTDAAVEVSYAVKNTTKGFAPVRVNAMLNADQTAQDAYLSIDSGSSCWETSGQLMVSSGSPIGYGGVLRGDYFVIVPNYYSPARPRGNTLFAKKACTWPSVYYGVPATSSFTLLQYARDFHAPALARGGAGCRS